MKKEFKYYPKDFEKLIVTVIHMDLDFDIYDTYTKVKSDLKLKALKDLKKLELNAKDLEILNVKCNLSELEYTYDKPNDKLLINFKKQIKKNSELIISTETICKPTNNTLEGLYYDITPIKNAPPQQITQCQQWGFQRLVPCIDDMTAKCTYITRITADSRYTNLISNGDIKEKRKSLGNKRDTIVYDNTKTPMAPYLFFLGVGTYSTFRREFEYLDGKKFYLEILTPPNTDKEIAFKALSILFNAVMWIHLFTGQEKYNNLEIKNKIYNLINKREQLKRSNSLNELEKIRQQIKLLSENLVLGYKYTGTVYREIGMQNSNFGGMENVGNTTITTNRLLPFKETTDPAFQYMIKVKVHEFYHNLNGSEVTGFSPFEIWLNEAVTVHIELEHLFDILGEDYTRLETVLSLIVPGGTFDKDSSVLSMPIEPNGFNNPDELITDVTYIKAPEFIRMIQTLIGKELFVKGLDLYHRTYKHSNATRNNWIQSMEKVSKMKFQEMSNTWLKQTNFPIIDIKTKYKSNNYVISIKQKKFKGKKPWEFPLDVALLDNKGDIIISTIKRIKGYNDKIVFNKIEKPFLTSINRGYSFYGKINYNQSIKELYNQVKLDPDIINKYIAFYKLTEIEKLNLLKNKQINEEFIDLFYYLLTNEDLTNKVGSLILSITQSVEDEKYKHKYQDLFEIKEKLLLAVAKKYKNNLLDIYKKYSVRNTKEINFVKKEVFNIKNRQIKNLCLSLLMRLDTKEIQDIIKKQYLESKNFTDRIAAFSLYLRTSTKDKLQIFEREQKESEKNLVHYESFLSVIGSNESSDSLDLIKKAEISKSFKIEQSNCQRALYATFASNKRKSLLTKEGLCFLKEIIIKLTPINEYTTTLIINKVFGKLDSLEKKHQPEIISSILDILKNIDKTKSENVYNNLTRALKNSKKAIKEYESFFKQKINLKEL